MAGRGKSIGAGGSKKPTSWSAKAGLQSPVGRIARFLKAGAVLDHLAPEVNHSGVVERSLRPANLNPRVTVHCGIPSTSSLLAFDPFQRLLAVGTLDGRIKIIGGDGIECLLDSHIQLPCKFLEFFNNQGHIVSITNQNDIQVWDLDARSLACYVQWESNITAFAVLQGTPYMYIGDDLGNVAVIKYDQDKRVLSQMPYHIPVHIIQETSKASVHFPSSVAGVFPQPSAFDTRVLITYENGLIILWDLYETQAVVVRGGTGLQLKSDAKANSSSRVEDETLGLNADNNGEEKEICSACWASVDGSILAVGYTDGDILLWSISSEPSGKDRQHEAGTLSSKIVVKLQLSSSKRRIPVIVLQWCASGKLNSDGGGRLFVYGGDEIGSPEVVTVLSLEWPQGLASLTCISRIDLMFDGSFADLMLLPSAGSTWSDPSATLLVLTNPGHLYAYDEAAISQWSLSSQESSIPAHAQPAPVQAPFVEPSATAAKLVLLPKDGKASKTFSQLPRVPKSIVPPTLSAATKWPVTGGVLSSASSNNSSNVEAVYLTGHANGTVKVWDASVPFLCLLCVVENKIQNVSVLGGDAPVSALEFCSLSEILIAGDEHGVVRLYQLSAYSGEVSCHVVSGTVKQAHILQCESGFQCVAVFAVHQSPICSLASSYAAARVTVGSEGGLVSIIDLHSFSILFHGQCSDNSTKIISMIMKTIMLPKGLLASPTSPKSESLKEKDFTEELHVVFVLTKDANIITIDGDTGAFLGSRPSHPKHQSTAVAFHLIDASSISNQVASTEYLKHACGEKKSQNDLNEVQADHVHSTELQAEVCFDNTISTSRQSLENLFLLLCSKDALRLYPASSVMQGNSNSIHKVNLDIPCCWTSTVTNKDENAAGLVLLYQNGLLEMRSLPDLEVVGDISLGALLRWKFQPNLLKTITSVENGRVSLIHNQELAFLSLLANENDLRIPDSLPCMHDRDIAAAADAALSVSLHQIKKKNQIQGFLGGVLKEIKGGVLRHAAGSLEDPSKSNIASELSSLFAWCPFAEPSSVDTSDNETETLDIDDIEIEDASIDSTQLSSVPASSRIFIDTRKSGSKGKHKRSERQKLLDEKSEELKPRMRTAEEIKVAYGHKRSGEVAGAAGLAMGKLQQRQEKLQTISKHTEELQAGAENFAAMADELLKTMEGRKWWKI